MTINETYQEIALITQNIIEHGLSIDEKWPKRTNSKISWDGQADVAIALKNIPYFEKYKILKKDRNYNFLMLDSGMVQMMYEFNLVGNHLVSHRLAFFPCPSFENYDKNPEAYEQQYFGDSEFHDLIEKNIVTFPVRFDYNADQKIFREIEHPYSHATFGESEFCRIPVKSPLTPSSFMNFILRNFYNYAFRTKGEFCPVSKHRFDASITPNEKGILHLNIS